MRLGEILAGCVVVAWLGGGCGYVNKNVSEPANPKLARAIERVPLRAVCELTFAGEEAEWLPSMSSFYGSQGASGQDAGEDGGGAALLGVKKGAGGLRKAGAGIGQRESILQEALEQVRARTAETALFERAIRSTGRLAEEGEVVVRLTENVTAVPSQWDIWRVIGIFPPFYPLLAIWTDKGPLDVDYQLQVIDAREDVLGRWSTNCRIAVESQTADGWMMTGRIEALTLAREHGLRVLLSKAVEDRELVAELKKRVRAPAPQVAQNPAPAPAPAPIPPPSAPAPVQPPPGPGGKSSSGGSSGFAAAPTGAAGRTFVLVVGVNQYEDKRIPALRFAEQDARGVYGFFSTDPKSPAEPDRVLILVGKDATRTRILRALREHLTAKATSPDDMVVLFFAGHGFADATSTYLAGSDARLDELPETAISLESLSEYWSKIRAGRKLLIADACRSGGLQGVRGVGGVRLAPGAGEPAAGPTGSITIAATGANELSTEDERFGQGVFTIALLNGLRGGADADHDGRVSADELSRYLEREVPALAARSAGKQTPTIEATPGSGGMLLTR